MSYFRKLETNTKLYACFLIVFCVGALLATWLLFSLADLTTAAARQRGLGAGAAGLLHDQFALMRNWALGAIGAGATVAVLLATWLAGEIARPIHEAVVVARRVAAGDLTTRIDSGAHGESGLLMLAMQEMNDKLVGIIVNVRTGSGTIANGAGEIATGNMDLSARTEQQAASLEETASSMEELTATVKQNADHAHQASKLAVSASEVAVKGGEVVAEVVGTMASINDSSKRISEIIGVIDGIAFQTNILALNAAVEAARAGEQGRGFAVVASEVRNLAQRSAAAAKEIKVLIDDSVDKVNAGTQLADKAGNTMNEVVTSVKRVTEIIGEIADASAEQTTGIEQVNQAIAAMDQATQQNAALVEESAAAAASVREQAVSLSRVIGAFVLAAEHDRPSVRTPLLVSQAGKSSPKKDARSKSRNSPAPASARPAAPPAAPPAAAPREAKRSSTTADLDWEEF